MIAGMGVDIARASRFSRLLEQGRQPVLDRIFTPSEQAYCLSKKDPAPHLAVRFAAKESFLKALGLGLRQGITWQDMEVVRDELGAPSLHLSGKAATIFKERRLSSIHLSYSHDGDYGVATVVLERP